MNLYKSILHKCRVLYQKVIPYSFKKGKYPNCFLEFDSKLSYESQKIDKTIYCFWTGNNPMTNNRLNAIESLRKKSGVPIKLITPTNLNTYILKEYPLHRAYSLLSLVHKSDYLRCYFMHHYGGGYCDVKQISNSWLSAFKSIENHAEKWVLGYSELNKHSVAQIEGKIGKDLKTYFKSVIGNCAYICRSKTKFTDEWYKELHNRLDNYYEELKKYPGNIMGDNKGYPIPWTNILGDIFHPLCLKYSNKIMHDDSVKPVFKNYR